MKCHFRGNELAHGEETCQNWLSGSTTRLRRNVNFKFKRLEIVFNLFIMSIVQPTSLFKIKQHRLFTNHTQRLVSS